MAAINVETTMWNEKIVPVTDIVGCGADGYFIKVMCESAYYIGFSIIAKDVVANGADSVLWVQAWCLDHKKNLAVNFTDGSDPGEVGLSTASKTNSVLTGGFEWFTSGGSGTYNQSTVVNAVSHASSIYPRTMLPGIALKMRADTGADSFTGGNVLVMPFRML